MKKRLIFLTVLLVVFAGMFAAVTVSAAAASPTAMWVEPSDTNGLPARIDVFISKTQTSSSGYGSNKVTTYTYTCMLCLPGTTVPADCALSWEGGMSAAVGTEPYDSGSCPVPGKGETTTYTFTEDKTVRKFVVTTYQGSTGVQSIFIDIDESQGTIAAMDGDSTHETCCTGRIYINGQWLNMPKIKGRGNYTWKMSKDKRAYNITLDTKIKFPGIDSDKTKKWSILSEVGDHSLLCNRVGFELAHELGVGQDTASADVWMNGEYQGCYTVTPKYDSFVSKDGYLIEDDNYQETLSVEDGGDPQFSLVGLNGNGSDYNLITVKKIGDNLLLKDGVVDESAENLLAVSAQIQNWLQDAWDAIRSEDGYNSQGKYYTDYIDIESFAKMYLMQEYVKSYDICAGSILFHRDGQTESDKLIAGPIWDLDNSLGSVQNNNNLGSAGDRRSGKGDFIPVITEYKTSIYKTLSRHADFMEEVQHQYNKYWQAFNALPSVVDEMKVEIYDSAMMNHNKVQEISNYNLHKYSGATTLESGTEYAQEMKATTSSKTDWPNYVDNLKSYVTARSLWFYNKFYDPNDPANCEHTYVAQVTAPTCITTGFTTYTCSKCGDSYVDDLTPIIAHDYQNGTCTVCGQTLINVAINCSKGATVTVYETQDVNGACVERATSTNPRNSDTGLIDCSGSGQVNFVVNLEPGYELDSVTAEPTASYNKLKLPADTGITNGYRLTKVSGDVTITVNAIRPLQITSQPTDYTGAAGSTIRFAVGASGDGLTYQWYYKKTGAADFVPSTLTAGTKATYTMKMADKYDGWQYYCVVTDARGNTAQSDTVTVHLSQPPQITVQPVDAADYVGATAAFSVTAETDTGDDLTYQWYYKTPRGTVWKVSPADGNQTATLSVPVTASRSGYQYRCIVKDSHGGSVTSAAATLSAMVKAEITSQPADFSGAVGSTITFKVGAKGDGLKYQWYFKRPGDSDFSKSTLTAGTRAT